MAATTERPNSRELVYTIISTIVIIPAVFLLLGGNWRWLEGWLFSFWVVVMILSSTIYLYRHDPALLAERKKRPGHDNQKKWDVYMSWGIYSAAIAWFVIMPLDAERFGWSPPFAAWLKALGAIALLPALYLIYRSTVENSYLSTAVRIQSERKQHVISTGVYSIVRHPLYLGCALMCLGAPLFLGSLYGFILGLIATVAVVVRILGEEKMLVEELEGYDEYRHKVRYRLVPYVW